jgi:hypothetical protein
MHIHRRLVHLSIVLGALAGLIAIPATPGLAGSLHATLAVVPLPPALTLSDTTTHSGLIKVLFATQNTSATHTLVTISTVVPGTNPPVSSPVTVIDANLSPPLQQSPCTGTASGSVFTTPVTCSLPNIGPNTPAPPILIEFESPSTCPGGGSPPCDLGVSASVTFSRGLLSSTESISVPPSPNVPAPAFQLFATTQKASADGDCLTFSAGTKTVGTIVSSTVAQSAKVLFGPAAAGPCTAAAAGAQPFPNGKPQNSPLVLNQIWFVELVPLAGTGLATATLQVANLPPGSNKNNFALREFVTDLYGTAAFDPTQFVTVQPCVGSPLQPPAGADSCVLDISNLPGGGLTITVILNPASGDASYSG